jgi:hypothetical protein
MPNLATLSIEHNQFNGAIPSYLTSATSLKNIYTYNNKLVGAVPALPFSQYSACYLSYSSDETSNKFNCPLPGNANMHCNIIGDGGNCRAEANPNTIAPTPSPSIADQMKRLKFEIAAGACGIFIVACIVYMYSKNAAERKERRMLNEGELPANRVYNAEEKAHARAVLKQFYSEHDPSKGTERNIK